MRGTRFVSTVLLATLLLGYLAPLAQENLSVSSTYSTGRSSGVDLLVESTSFSYANSVDQQKYQMFSSNGPIAGRPDSLFVIDTVLDLSLIHI